MCIRDRHHHHDHDDECGCGCHDHHHDHEGHHHADDVFTSWGLENVGAVSYTHLGVQELPGGGYRIGDSVADLFLWWRCIRRSLPSRTRQMRMYCWTGD